MPKIKTRFDKQILDTLDYLRSVRKGCNIANITHVMLKKYKIVPKDTKAELRRCIKDSSIIIVDVKGTPSYRNATRVKRYKSSVARKLVTSAIASLIYVEHLKKGITFDDLVGAVGSLGSNYSKQQLEDIVDKELSSGSLIKLTNGNLVLGPNDHNTVNVNSDNFFQCSNDFKKMITSFADTFCISSPQEKKGRTSKVPDPSDNIPKQRNPRGRPTGSLNKKTIMKRARLKKNLRKVETTNSIQIIDCPSCKPIVSDLEQSTNCTEIIIPDKEQSESIVPDLGQSTICTESIVPDSEQSTMCIESIVSDSEQSTICTESIVPDLRQSAIGTESIGPDLASPLSVLSHSSQI